MIETTTGMPDLSSADSKLMRVHEPSAERTSYYLGEDSMVGEKATSCAFCGDRAMVWKPLVPRSRVRQMVRAAPVDVEVWTWAVPCCDECNSILGQELYASPESMREHVRDTLERRNADVLSMEDHDLDEYGPGLRAYLEASSAKRDIAKERVEHKGPFPRSFGSPSVNMRIRNMT